jgi:hypothetical protein
LVKTWSQKAFQAVAVRISENAVLRIGHAYSSVETFLFVRKTSNSGSCSMRTFSTIARTFTGGKGKYSNQN